MLHWHYNLSYLNQMLVILSYCGTPLGGTTEIPVHTQRLFALYGNFKDHNEENRNLSTWKPSILDFDAILCCSVVFLPLSIFTACQCAGCLDALHGGHGWVTHVAVPCSQTPSSEQMVIYWEDFIEVVEKSTFSKFSLTTFRQKYSQCTVMGHSHYIPAVSNMERLVTYQTYRSSF